MMSLYFRVCFQNCHTLTLGEMAINTTRKTSSCGGPIAAGAKTAAICRLLRRIFGPPLYMRSIAAFFVTAAIGRVFCGVL